MKVATGTSQDTGAPPPPEPSLRRRALHGSAWVLSGHVVAQTLRLGSNLVLTRLLFPEVFGLMALVTTFLQGLQMFSDVGIEPSIVQSRRGDDPRFLNTAFTIQVLRGGALFACACLIGWPASAFYAEPELIRLLPAAGLTALLAGFNSTRLVLLNRHLSLGRRTSFDVGVQAAGIASAILLAWWWRSIWALVAGNVIEALLRMTLSHVLFGGARNRLEWDTESRRELFRFGRWIFVGTLLSFIVSQSDRLILGKLMTMETLGLYAIALRLAQMIVEVMRSYSGKVLFPLYARLRERGAGEMRRQMLKVRGALLAVMLPPLCVLVVFGDQIIRLLYDPRYEGAGWILQVLAAGAIASTIGLTISPVLLAMGDSFRHMLAMACQSGLAIAAMATGAYAAGPNGVVCGLAVSKFLTYPVNAVFARRHGAWLPALDVAAFGGCAVLILVGQWLRP